MAASHHAFGIGKKDEVVACQLNFLLYSRQVSLEDDLSDQNSPHACAKAPAQAQYGMFEDHAPSGCIPWHAFEEWNDEQ